MSLVDFVLRRRSFLASVFSLLAWSASAHAGAPGAVYTLSNAPDANQVVAFDRTATGALVPAGVYPTGGRGTGAALGSQGALALSGDGRFLVAVNAASDDVSVLEIRPGGLVLTDQVSSGGLHPVSVTIADNLVYVLNAGGAAGGADAISGFFLSRQGKLLAIPGSTRALSAAQTAPAQVSLARRGDVLLVTERATQRIDGFVVDDRGRAGPAVVNPSSGAVPFGFAVSSRGQLFVSEAPASALSSYHIGADGRLDLVTASLANHQGAACWVVLSKDEDFVYTANAATNSISAYQVFADGSVALRDSSGLTAATDDGPLDLAVTNNGRFLYTLHGRARSIVGYRVNEDGGLTRVADAGGLLAGPAGLVAR